MTNENKPPMALQALPLISPITVGPSPQETEIAVAAMPFNGRPIVLMQVATPTGVLMYFLDPEMARKVGLGLQAAAGRIVLAPAGALPTEGEPR